MGDVANTVPTNIFGFSSCHFRFASSCLALSDDRLKAPSGMNVEGEESSVWVMTTGGPFSSRKRWIEEKTKVSYILIEGRVQQ